MANEATLFIRTNYAIPFTIANSNSVEKGAFVRMIDPFTISGSAVVEGTFGGIAASEKIANDGKTKLGVYRDGVFKVTLSGSCTIGDPLGLDFVANMVKSVKTLTDGQLSGSRILGIALETGATGETILMELRPQAQGAG